MISDQAFLTVTNAMKTVSIHRGDRVIWQPGVRKSLRRVKKANRRRFDASFAGIADEQIMPKHMGQIQVYGIWREAQ